MAGRALSRSEGHQTLGHTSFFHKGWLSDACLTFCLLCLPWLGAHSGTVRSLRGPHSTLGLGQPHSEPFSFRPLPTTNTLASLQVSENNSGKNM